MTAYPVAREFVAIAQEYLTRAAMPYTISSTEGGHVVFEIDKEPGESVTLTMTVTIRFEPGPKMSLLVHPPHAKAKR